MPGLPDRLQRRSSQLCVKEGGCFVVTLRVDECARFQGFSCRLHIDLQLFGERQSSDKPTATGGLYPISSTIDILPKRPVLGRTVRPEQERGVQAIELRN